MSFEGKKHVRMKEEPYSKPIQVIRPEFFIPISEKLQPDAKELSVWYVTINRTQVSPNAQERPLNANRTEHEI